jgi:hypothetical protein
MELELHIEQLQMNGKLKNQKVPHTILLLLIEMTVE